ncbi:lysophospholipid acyltransferase family protein [candidate division CSSED10-310 bacterium]|uniref:Lysophospholipid acyltransferase family protein n=1 Tax=candidate division CSSED10-310 bacterium TaxID=2855610 RepID=A0ABV6YZU2_UNCC1
MANLSIVQNSKLSVYKRTEKKITSHLFKGVDSVLTYLWINLTAVVSLIFFKLLNRTEIIGRENIPDKTKVLLCSNHQTMIDSFLIGAFAFFPKVLIRPDLLPYHPAALENFFKGRILSWMSRKWRCIPVRRGNRGEKDMFALSQMIKTLKRGTMILFPEGTRSRTGRVGPGRVGVGKLIHDTKPVVVPVAIHGMDKVLPIGASFPHFFQKIRIIYGKPIDLEEYFQMPEGVQTSRLIVDSVISEITDLHDLLGTRAYLEKAKKISQPLLREKEISELSSLHGDTTEAPFKLPEQPLSTLNAPEEYVDKDQIH